MYDHGERHRELSPDWYWTPSELRDRSTHGHDDISFSKDHGVGRATSGWIFIGSDQAAERFAGVGCDLGQGCQFVGREADGAAAVQAHEPPSGPVRSKGDPSLVA
jgi:hypothetical protein